MITIALPKLGKDRQYAVINDAAIQVELWKGQPYRRGSIKTAVWYPEMIEDMKAIKGMYDVNH